MELLAIGCWGSALGYLIWGYRTRLAKWVPAGVNPQLFKNPKQGSTRLSADFSQWLTGRVSPTIFAGLAKKLERAGRPAGEAPHFLAKQILLSVGGSILGLVFWSVLDTPFLAILFATAGYFLPAQTLNSQIRKRQRAIVLCFPYYLDLITLALEAGLDLIVAIEEVVGRDQNNPLREELLITLKSIRMGTLRSVAFQDMANRTGVEAMSLWASSIAQSEQLGSSLGSLLRLQSETLRREIFSQAEALAQKAPVKMLAPLIICIFPVVFILLFVPIALKMTGGF